MTRTTTLAGNPPTFGGGTQDHFLGRQVRNKDLSDSSILIISLLKHNFTVLNANKGLRTKQNLKI